jgi:hypothetical protein
VDRSAEIAVRLNHSAHCQAPEIALTSRKVYVMSLRLSTNTKLSPAPAMEQAVRYFAGELGLTAAWQSASAARFEGGGGHVEVSAAATPHGTELELETMEWEIQVRQFASNLPR